MGFPTRIKQAIDDITCFCCPTSQNILRNIAKIRNPLYEKLSTFIIEETDNPNQTVDNILDILGKYKWKS